MTPFFHNSTLCFAKLQRLSDIIDEAKNSDHFIMGVTSVVTSEVTPGVRGGDIQGCDTRYWRKEVTSQMETLHEPLYFL